MTPSLFILFVAGFITLFFILLILANRLPAAIISRFSIRFTNKMAKRKFRAGRFFCLLLFSFLLLPRQSQAEVDVDTPVDDQPLAPFVHSFPVEQSDVEFDEDLYYQEHAKYEGKVTESGNVKLNIVEYVAPGGEKGYQVYETKTEKDGVYYRSYGKGPQAIARSYGLHKSEVSGELVLEKKGFWQRLVDWFIPPVYAADLYSATLNSANSEFLSIPGGSADSLTSSGNFTVMGWVNVTSLPSGGQWNYIISDGSDGYVNYALRFLNNGVDQYIQLFTYKATPYELRMLSYATTTPTSQWVHYAGTYDGTYFRLYINGDFVTSTLNTRGLVTSSSLPFAIGSNSGTPGHYLNGKVDEFQVWDTALTETQIKNNYNRELCPDEIVSPLLKGYWKFDYELLDATPNNNDLTDNNSVGWSADVPVITNNCVAVVTTTAGLMTTDNHIKTTNVILILLAVIGLGDFIRRLYQPMKKTV